MATPATPATPTTTFRDEVKALSHRSKTSLILRGLASVAIGIFILARPMASAAALALVIALWALFEGIANIVHAIDLRRVVPHWWALLLTGLISAVFGVAALYYYPGLSLSFAVIWAALWLISVGVLGIFVSMQEKRMGASWGWTLVLGIITIAFGVLALMYPHITVAGLVGLLAAYLIAIGVAELAAAFQLQSWENRIQRSLPADALRARA
jgi:uncharacterized membrane protein HdeD (DUF308 family)